MATNAVLLANETDLEKILEVSYISKTVSELLELARETSNEATFSQQLDSFQNEIFGDSDWKDRLKECHNGNHYKEFLVRNLGGCKQPSSSYQHRRQCRECNDDYGYKNRPRCLLRFIRNLHEHAPEKMKLVPRGYLETNLFPNEYKDKRNFVLYFMKKFPNLFHIVAALRQKQIDWFNWSDSVPDQVVDGLTNALNFERDHGAVIQKFQCNQLDGWGKCELEVIASHEALVYWNIGKVLRIQATSLSVNHKPGEILTYSINNPGNKTFNVLFGMEQLSTINLSSSKVILLTSLYEKVEDVSTALKNFGEFEQIDLKWDDISREAQGRIRSSGSILVQKQTYPASRFSLEKLSGVHLNKLLKSECLELFRTGNIDPEYVKRLLICRTFNGSQPSTDAVNFIKNCNLYDGHDMTPHVQINSDSELLALNKLSVPYVLMNYNVSFTKDCIYEKILNLASGKDIRLLEYVGYDNDLVSSTVQVIRQEDLLKEAKEELVFITGGPGEGKTTLLKNFHPNLNIPETVVLHMSAHDLVSKYDSKLPAIQAVANCCRLDDFEKEVIRELKVVFLVDALDEAKSDTTEIINGLLQVDNVRIVVSVRNYLESKLMSKFCFAKFCPLANLEERDQVSIFLSTWRKLGGSACEATAKQLVSTYRKAFNLTPLIGQILAEVYADPKNNIPNDTVLSKLKIYELIVRKNFRRYLIEKKKVPEENVEDDIYQKLFMDYIRAHVFLAIKCLLESTYDLCEYFEGLESQDEVELTPGQGLLESLEPPIFIHQTFAEFLIDWWVFLVLTGKIKIIKTYVPAFSKIFEEQYVYGIAGFLEMMLEEHKDPVLYNFQMINLDLEHIEMVFWGYASTNILKTWVGSLKHFCTRQFEEEMVSISETHRWYEIRPYVPRDAAATVKYFTKIRGDCIIRWLGFGERPSELLETFPNGFYLRDQGHGIYYVPEESAYAKDDKTIVGAWVNYPVVLT